MEPPERSLVTQPDAPNRSPEPARGPSGPAAPSAAASAAMRASDRERDEAAEALRRHAGEGRLDVDELSERLDGVYAARTRAELAALTADLPGVVAPAPAPTRAPSPSRAELRGHVLAFLAVNALLIAIWAATGADYFWPIWPLLGWGLGLVSHTSEAFGGRRLGPCHRRRRALHPAR